MKKYFILIVFFCLQITYSQDGALDPAFNPNDTGIGKGDEISFFDYNNDSALQFGNKLIFVGPKLPYINSNNKVDYKNNIFRLNEDGSYDNTFIGSHFSYTNGNDNCLFRLILKPDNKILVVGSFDFYNDTPTNGCVQLNTDGSIDNSFHLANVNGVPFYGRYGTLQSDGKLILLGNTNNTTNNFSFLVRFNIDGSLDTSFGINRITFLDNSGIHELSFYTKNNSLLIYGAFDKYNNNVVTGKNILKLNSNGTIDSNFNSPLLSQIIYSVEETANNGLFVSGMFSGNNAGYNIFKLNPDFSVDTTFQLTNTQLNCSNIKKQGSNYLITDLTQQKIVRITENGQIDNTFTAINLNSVLYGYFSQNFIKFSDNTIYISGIFNKFDSNGNIQPNYRVNTGFNGKVRQIERLSNGKLVAMGDFTKYNNQAVGKIVQLNLDGTLNINYSTYQSYNTSRKTITLGNKTLLFESCCSTTASMQVFDENGNQYLNFLAYDSSYQDVIKINDTSFFLITYTYPSYHIIKYDITLGSSFIASPGFINSYRYNGLINSIVIKENGKLIVNGTFNGFYTTGSTFINTAGTIQLNSDGTFNSNVTMPVSFAQNNFNLFFFNSGNNKVIISNKTNNKTIQINDDLSIDTTFRFFNDNNCYINNLLNTSGGKKTILTTKPTTLNIWNHQVLRINSDGTLDNSFTISESENIDVDHPFASELVSPLSITEQYDGKIVVAGDFVSFNGYNKNRILRLNSTSNLVYIPDNHFKLKLIENGLLETNIENHFLKSDMENMITLNIENANIDDLTGIEYCIHLKNLNCKNNHLSYLNLDKNSSMITLNCSGNDLHFLSLKNGNNHNITSFDSSLNTNLTCIIVDDKNSAYLNNFIKDTNSHFVNNNSDCGNVNDIINGDKTIVIYPNPTSDKKVTVSYNKTDSADLKIYNFKGQLVNYSRISKGINQIDLSKVANGIYLFAIDTETIKVILN